MDSGRRHPVAVAMAHHPGSSATPVPPAPLATDAGGDLAVLVTCLGRFQFSLPAGHPIEWRSTKSRALLQYLLNHRDRPIQRDTLIDALWPDPRALAPATSLKVAVHGLRHALAAGGGGIPVTIVAHHSAYSLEASRIWLDVEEFEHCYQTGRASEARGFAAEALRYYARAAELYRGDFLEEIADEWPVFRREALKDQYLFLATALARAAITSGDYQEGVTLCQQILTKDRCREEAYQMLMVCHSKLGQRGRIRCWYNLCVRTLKTELDCSPAPETSDTYLRALTGAL